MKNDCFAMKKNGECKILLAKYYVEYLKERKCGNDGCPFYKPHGKTKAYKRGLSLVERERINKRLKDEG